MRIAAHRVPSRVGTERVVAGREVEGPGDTRDALVQRGFSVQLTEINGHTHDYYSRSSEINKAAWAFLKVQALTGSPVFTKHEFAK